MSDIEAPATETTWSYDGDVDLRAAVFQALAAVTMCWDPPPGDQVFQSLDVTRATAIADALLAKIAELTGGSTDGSD